MITRPCRVVVLAVVVQVEARGHVEREAARRLREPLGVARRQRAGERRRVEEDEAALGRAAAGDPLLDGGDPGADDTARGAQEVRHLAGERRLDDAADGARAEDVLEVIHDVARVTRQQVVQALGDGVRRVAGERVPCLRRLAPEGRGALLDQVQQVVEARQSGDARQVLVAVDRGVHGELRGRQARDLERAGEAHGGVAGVDGERGVPLQDVRQDAADARPAW